MARAKAKPKIDREKLELMNEIEDMKGTIESSRRHFAEQERRNAELAAFNNDLKARQEIIIDFLAQTAAMPSGELVLINVRKQASEMLRRISMMPLRTTK